MPRFSVAAALLVALAPLPLVAMDYHVSTTGDNTAAGTKTHPWKTLQHALDQLKPGDTAHAAAGIYNEKIVFKTSGKEGSPITLQAASGAIISGKDVKGENLILIENHSHIRVHGFELRDNLGVKDGSGIRIQGHGNHLELRHCRIHEVRGKDAMGITVYGTSAEKPIQHLIIDSNEIYDCDPAKSEALVLNGNVSDFQVTNNVVRDVNNIGIDFIGGEAWANQNTANVARNGLCKGNKVYRCRSTYEDGYAAGIYVDGGRNIIIEHNLIVGCDLGIEIGAENRLTTTSGITVRNNTIYHNDKAGIVFGGYEKKAGRVTKCSFTGNIVYQNNRHADDHNGELWIQWATGNNVTNNTFVTSGSDAPLANVDAGGIEGNTLDHNRYYTDAGESDAFFLWAGEDVNSFAAWKAITRQDQASTFAPAPEPTVK